MIEFPEGEAIDGIYQTINFRATSDGKQILCAVSYEALQDGYGARDNYLEAFRSNRGDIEAIAEKLIKMNRVESDGRIIIRSADV